MPWCSLMRRTRRTLGSCNTASCAGGSGSGASWVAFNETTPALFCIKHGIDESGTGFETRSGIRHLGANNAVSNIELDFYLMVNSASPTWTQAIQNGPQQYVGG